MVKIYKPEEVKVENIKADRYMRWSYPVTEIEYLLEDGTADGYVLLDDGRLWEVFEDDIRG